MTPDLARIALELLARTPLKGAEVDAFNAVRAALAAILNPPKTDADIKVAA